MLSEIIRGAMLVHSTRLSVNNIQVEKLGDFDVRVLAEPTQLEVVFINLISNAIGVLSNQAGLRQINLECSFNHHHCTIDVRDNGPGIRPEVLRRIGEIYVSDRQSGSGVGLWLTKEIIESHGGQLIASNQEKGGASFRVILPVL
jgi:C4-dicarboxylate-specific signal transduction histidine kinase